jgi:acyl-CoA synthetase (AMP-forming)/AMP-acid ligase II
MSLDGELFVSGRLKDLVIIAGRNHYPQDIEITVEESHPALRPGGCATFSVEIDDEERLVVLVELNPRFRSDGARHKRKTPDGTPSRGTQESRSSETEIVGESNVVDPEGIAGVIKSIRQAVSDRHGVGVYKAILLRAGGISKTSSGKTQRRACRARFLSGSLSAWEIEAAYTIER